MIRLVCLCSLVTASGLLQGESISVKHAEGTLHGFLKLTDEAGKQIATGDLIQSVKGDEVSSRLVFHFRDGSVDDERSLFTQRGKFRLLRDEHVQRGPSFPHPYEVKIDVKNGKVTTSIFKDGGQAETDASEMKLPDDLANGLPLLLVKNIPPDTPETRVSYVASTPKPRLIHLSIKPDGQQAFAVGRSHYKADCFRFHVELGGIAGVVAPMFGKEPEDSLVWVLGGQAPSFIRAELPFYVGGPVWTIQLTSPEWPRNSHSLQNK